MQMCDIVDVLTRLRVSPDHHAGNSDNDSLKADDKDGSPVASAPNREVQNGESEKLSSHHRQKDDDFNHTRSLSEAVFAAFKQSPEKSSNTPKQAGYLAATPTKTSMLPMTPPTGSPSRSIPEIIEATRARSGAAPMFRQIYDRAQARSRLPLKKPTVTVSDILDFKKALAEKTGVVYVGEEALAETTLAPSKAYINEGNTQIRVFKNHSDIEREDEQDKYKLEIEEQVKNDFKQLISSKKPPLSDSRNCPGSKISSVVTVESEVESVAESSSSIVTSTSGLARLNPDGADSKKSSTESETSATNKPTSNTPRSGPFRAKLELKTDPVDFIPNLKSLSKAHNFTSGKWLISVPWDEVDNTWNIIKTEFVNDNLTEETRFIKVYGRQDNEENPHFRRSTGGRYSYNAMISIMTNDWTDEAKTMEVAKRIRSAGVKAVLRYKPDISTTLEIYSGNTMRAKPTVYTLDN